ncbi:hypothetical protein [Methylosinus sp. KRF6]|uniref:hypothetical protein n=1 Tax=Methylosinus sp. KRF6 TaxID=2846853 RepID=UPI001C0DC59F|nr:hypothetical protein [Methylosinus sp. KRF6]MBU3890811.1 hypothetical protein [Methylosinus sp. KRF6]
MALEIQNAIIKLSEGSQTLTFGGPIKQYVAGLTGFNMSYAGGKGHDVQTCSLGLQFNQPIANQLTVKVDARLSDNGGNNLDTPAAWVTIGVLAVVDVDPDNITLKNETGIPSGGRSNGIPLAESTPVLNVAVLSGFDLSYGSGSDHDVQVINASVSISQDAGTDYVEGEALMKDGGKNSASTAKVDGGALATFKTNAGVVLNPILGKQSASAITVEMADLVPSGYRLGGTVAVVLTGYQISYGGSTGNDVNTLGAGLIAGGGYDGVWASPGLPTVDGTVVTIPGPQSYMYDLGITNHPQDNEESYVDLMVIGLLLPV